MKDGDKKIVKTTLYRLLGCRLSFYEVSFRFAESLCRRLHITPRGGVPYKFCFSVNLTEFHGSVLSILTLYCFSSNYDSSVCTQAAGFGKKKVQQTWMLEPPPPPPPLPQTLTETVVRIEDGTVAKITLTKPGIYLHWLS